VRPPRRVQARLPSSGERLLGRHTVQARKGAGFEVQTGQMFSVINTHGNQVVDFWAVSLEDPTEFMSMVHTRSTLAKLVPKAGDLLYSNLREPLVRFVEDTSPGVHDTVVAACDANRYRLLGVEGFHDSCSNNFMTAMQAAGIDAYRQAPESFNLFMNIPWSETGELQFLPTVSNPGDYVTFEALRPLLMVVSSCPQDIVPINSGNPVEFDIEISG
jgi:uncharacterized protein YcgI (DUF1989 family)